MKNSIENSSQLVRELAAARLLLDAPPELLKRIVTASQAITLIPGESLLCPESPNEHVYVVLAGSLGVHFDKADTPRINTLGPGDSVGEMSVIDDTAPSAYVIAEETTRVFPIHRDLLVELISERSPVARNLLSTLSKWVRQSITRIVNDRAEIGLLSSHVHIDALTGVRNRRWFDSALHRLLVQSQEHGLSLSLLLLDVDHFKQYNDRHGHSGGDQALRAMGHLLSTAVRPSDFSARYGGEEFAVILPATRVEEAVGVAERIRQGISKLAILTHTGEALPGITASIGLSAISEGSTVQSLIDQADQALYKAKADGRNCVRTPG